MQPLYRVSVVDPQQHGEGRKMYTSYGVDVAINTSSGSGSSPSIVVRRRYSDFQWLAQRLHAERPGAILPVIPHKRAITPEVRFNENLIKERRAVLETYLQEVVVHPEIVVNQQGDGNIPPSLKAFFTLYTSTEAFEEAKKELEKANPHVSSDADGADREDRSASPTQPEAMSGRIRNLVARSVVAASLLSGQMDVLETTEHETEIEITNQYVEGMAMFIKELSNASGSIVKSTADRGSALDSFADAIFGWCLAHRERFCPNTTDLTVEAFRKVNEFTKYMSKVETKKADQEREHLENALQDLQRRIYAIQRALTSRKEYQVTYTTRVQQVNRCKAALAKWQGSHRLDKIGSAQTEAASAQQQADKAKQALDIITERVLREMKRTQDGLDDQLREAVAEYARIQVQHMQTALDGWSKFIPHVAVINGTASYSPSRTSSISSSNNYNNNNGKLTATPPRSSFLPPPPSAPAVHDNEDDDKVVNGDQKQQLIVGV